MDWTFYLILLFVLFGFVAVISIVRYLMNRRLESLERRLQMEKEAEQTAESNSGL